VEVVTRFGEEKRTARRLGTERSSGLAVSGYEIHHGVVEAGAGADPWFDLEAEGTGPEPEGVADRARAIYGTTLHGVLENDGLRAAWLTSVAARRGKPFVPGPVPFAEVRRRRVDVVADALAAHLDLDTLWRIVAEGVTS
jgi:adenosylcobyric acid synthase